MVGNRSHQLWFWTFTSGSARKIKNDIPKQVLAHTLRTDGQIFEIQTAYSVQVRKKWWNANFVAENLLPVLTGKGFLLITFEVIDGFMKFKRHAFRFDCSHDLTFLLLEIYFRFEQKIKNWSLNTIFENISELNG